MSLSIIGAGLGRTGTLSLKRALEFLGFGPCYHSLDSSRDEIERVFLALNQDPPNLIEAFSRYSATVDAPAYIIYKELARTFATAKVILTIREPTSYFLSLQALMSEMNDEPIGPHERKFGRGISSVDTPISQIYGNYQNREAVLEGFRRHNTEVQESISADRLLVFDVAQGWQPLCAFLGCRVPSVPFPHANSTVELPSLLRRLGRTGV